MIQRIEHFDFQDIGHMFEITHDFNIVNVYWEEDSQYRHLAREFIGNLCALYGPLA